MTGLTATPKRRFLSLRWQAFVALSITLGLSNALIGLVAWRDAQTQFELQQSIRRGDNARLLERLLTGTDASFAGLSNLLPLLSVSDRESPVSPLPALQHALDQHGALLALEWDVLGVHWIDGNDALRLSWPGTPLPAPVLHALSPSATAGVDLHQMLHCRETCRQYLAAPLLWRGEPAGMLVLVRSVANALLTFHQLTGSEAAIALREEGARELRFPATTHPTRTRPILDDLGASLPAPAASGSTPVTTRESAGRRYEIYRLSGFADELAVLVVDDVSAAQQVIQASTRNSVLLGAASLLFSGLALVWLAHYPLRRLRLIADSLPLLAAGRYQDLRRQLSAAHQRVSPADELDQLRDTTLEIAGQMESIEQDRQEARLQASWLGDHDPLTQLQNRKGFLDKLATTIKDAARYSRDGALLLIDIDHFREFNDLHGNRNGDRLLIAVARQLRELLRPSDVVARLGGDEFAIILAEGSQSDAVDCAARIQEAIAREPFETATGAIRVSLSIGIATFSSQQTSAEHLMLRADIALNKARSEGQGRRWLLPADAAESDAYSERGAWRQRIDDALASDRLLLFFQPVVDIRSGKLAHCESLLRMRGEGSEIFSPYLFIPVAEETGQILDIDHWVIRRAIATLAADERLTLSANLSARALFEPSMLREIPNLLRDANVAPQRLILEVTETAAMRNLSEAGDVIAELAARGCHFALDDFGSGYASYSHLRHLPVSEVKIDGAFITNLRHNRDDQIFVKSMTELLHGLGKSVVAEFVEDRETLELLATLNVDMAQGYHLGHPDPSPNFGPWPPGSQDSVTGVRE